MLDLGNFKLAAPAVMGILNVTPDSFSDGGKYALRDAAQRHAARMAAEGAAIIDIGGESTRPGASAVSEQQEIDRVLPVVEAVRAEIDLPISIDTSKPGVMRAAIGAGASMINDVRALREAGALEAAAKLQVPVCLMHIRGEPRTMQQDPVYEDVVSEVRQFLEDRISACRKHGLRKSRIVVDPGFGFGKMPEHNMELLANLQEFRTIGVPILFGASRKSTLGAMTGRDVDQRLPASLAAAVLAVERGAGIVRVHDVAETVDALKIASATLEADRSR